MSEQIPSNTLTSEKPRGNSLRVARLQPVIDRWLPKLKRKLGDDAIEVKDMHLEGFYNAAAWEDKAGKTCLLGRQVTERGSLGKPDVGNLVLHTLGSAGDIESSGVIWEPKPNGYLLEDPRVMPLKDGNLLFGLTSVEKIGNDYIPHPAVMITSTEQLLSGHCEPTVITDMGSGDQTTPVGSVLGKNATAIDENSLIFRPEGPENNHVLRVFEYKDGLASKQQADIKMPDTIPWAQFRIGTTISPIWLDEHQAIFPVHGISIVNNKYEYSIGSARMVRAADGALSVDNISQEPFIDPDIFADMFGGDELHAERRVVYCCGGILKHDARGTLDKLKLYVNVGDKRTVEVTVPVARLMQGWPDTL